MVSTGNKHVEGILLLNVICVCSGATFGQYYRHICMDIPWFVYHTCNVRYFLVPVPALKMISMNMNYCWKDNRGKT
jgi:hypothetical protein